MFADILVIVNADDGNVFRNAEACCGTEIQYLVGVIVICGKKAAGLRNAREPATKFTQTSDGISICHLCEREEPLVVGLDGILEMPEA